MHFAFRSFNRFENEYIAVKEMRKHAAWYLKGIRGNAKVRNAINECQTRDELVTLLMNFVEEVEAKEVML